MSDFESIYGDDIKWHLSLRSEQPIEGCELQPHPFLRIKSHTLDNPAKARLLESNPHFYKCRWFRGPRKNPCANVSCAKNTDFRPSRWSHHQSTGHSVLCAVCERGGAPRYEAMFCSLRFEDV